MADKDINDERLLPSTAADCPPLPGLTDKPVAYSGCCFALSAPLLAHLHSLLPPRPTLILSIGSGYGLLEALLIAEPYGLNIVGIEVEPSSNRYLPAMAHQTVYGSRFLTPLAREAATWLFVYPRRVGLVGEYLGEFNSSTVTQIIWIGPQSDWTDYAGCFKQWDVRTYAANQVGGRISELISIAQKRQIHIE